MNRRITLTLMLLFTALIGLCKVWTINNAGYVFAPDTIIIAPGDSVNFFITSTHDAREVTQATWNANGSTALQGGFQTAYGGGLVLPVQLGLGTHYYVCTPHASMAMKGVIIVQNVTGIPEHQFQESISVFPNPSTGKFQLTIDNSPGAKKYDLLVYNTQGEKIYQSFITGSKSEIDLSNQAGGTYFIEINEEQSTLRKRIVFIK